MRAQVHTPILKSLFKTSLTTIYIVSASLLITSCATQEPVKEEKVQTVENPGVFAWPPPPEKPRIRYVESISETSRDTAKKATMADRLLGSREEVDKVTTLTKPKAVHVDANGRIFVTDSAPNVFVVFDRAADRVEFWGTQGLGKLSAPIGIASDDDGRIYVADRATKRVVIFDEDGRYVQAIGGEDILQDPIGVAVDDTGGRIYVSDTTQHKILVFDMQGALLSEIGERGNEPGQFNFPSFLEVSKSGKLFVSDAMNFRIQVFSLDGEYETSWGGVGKRPGNFNRLKDIAVDAEGHVVAVDSSFNNFQIFDETGQLFLWVGEGKGPKPGYFSLPVGVAIDNHNKIYIADSLNQRIQIFEFLPDPELGSPEGAE